MTTRPESFSSSSAARMRSATAGMVSSGFFSRTFTLTMTCGKTLRSAVSSSMLLPLRAIRSSTTRAVSRPSPVVARCGKQNVAGLFAAQRGIFLLHLLQDVAVAHGGAQHADAGALERGFKAHVRHGGGDDHVPGEHAARFQVARRRCSRIASPLMTLPRGPASMQRSASPSKVTPMSAPAPLHFGRDPGGMQRAAAVVDVAAVGRDVEQGDIAAEAAEQFRGDGGGRAVGAVGNDAQPVEIQSRNAVDAGTGCSPAAALIVFDAAGAMPGSGAGAMRGVMQDLVFDGELIASGSLKPSAPKSLMPLSRQGLCEAEITTPAANPCVRVRNATAGVVTMPALSTLTPAWRRPAASVAAIHGLDSRVSRPRMTRRLCGYLRQRVAEGQAR